MIMANNLFNVSDDLYDGKFHHSYANMQCLKDDIMDLSKSNISDVTSVLRTANLWIC